MPFPPAYILILCHSTTPYSTVFWGFSQGPVGATVPGRWSNDLDVLMKTRPLSSTSQAGYSLLVTVCQASRASSHKRGWAQSTRELKGRAASGRRVLRGSPGATVLCRHKIPRGQARLWLWVTLGWRLQLPHQLFLKPIFYLLALLVCFFFQFPLIPSLEERIKSRLSEEAPFGGGMKSHPGTASH